MRPIALLMAAFCLWFDSIAFCLPEVDQSGKILDRLTRSAQSRHELAQDTGAAVERAIRASRMFLTKRGLKKDGDRIWKEWEERRWFFMQLDSELTGKDIGDHEPIKWLYDTWAFLNKMLGEQTMKYTHLDDLWIFAYSIPVVFTCLDQVDAPEYAAHFIPFAGSLTYWSAMIACTIGAPAPWSMLCSPLGELCEYAMVTFIAPKITDKVWKLSCEG